MKLYQLHILCVVNSCPLLTQTFPNSSLPVKSVHIKATALSKQVPPHTHICLLRVFLSLPSETVGRVHSTDHCSRTLHR